MGAWGTVSTPDSSLGLSGTDRASGTLDFPVWFLDLVVLVLFVFENPLFLGFLLDFSKIRDLRVLSTLDLLPMVL